MSQRKKGLWWKLLLGGLAVVVVLAVISGGGSSGNLISGDRPQQEAFSAVEFNHRSAMLGEYEKGELLRFSGEVRQTMGSNGAMVRADNKNIWLVFPVDERKTTKGDHIEVMGRFLGTKSYKNAFKVELTVPVVQVDYFMAEGH